ncbi:hypothetical protein SAY86_000054 [Trapa natans]|uniref:Uncharacterized protein n=1 Tax=Trapa natans TaxID=22666 RepID=A0AAN7MEE5_TRANT|nr:hypothetical protein SAY86_000054 [Trapa natans]
MATMEAHHTQIDNLWVVALASKLLPLPPGNIAILLAALFLTSLGLSLAYWLHPGGPAWGRTRAARGCWVKNKPIPGPRGLPFIGSMDLMTGLAHHKLARAACRNGARRLMALSLGETRVIVTCHPDVAREILNSSHFADRPVKESAYSLLFNRAIGFAPYGTYWRTLRRIAATHLFCPRQIMGSEARRRELAAQMTSAISGFGSEGFRPREVLKRASLNSMMSSVFGRDYDLVKGSNDEVEELKGMVEEGYDLLGQLNLSDHVPWIAALDPQKIRFRCSRLVPRVNQFVGRIIDEHRNQKKMKMKKKSQLDFVDVLLSLEGPDQLAETDMIAVLWEMIFRGTDTVAVLIEWILARMVVHPQVQSRVQEELDGVVGRSRPVLESDLPALVYLTAVVKEVLRMHPPGPLLSWARLAITDTKVDGHYIPAGTTAMVNMWAITRDPEVWADPESFMPKRFLPEEGGAEVSVYGSDLRLAPFGSGRRVCPGKALGITTATHWVAHLLHEFEWLPAGQDDPVDLGEVLRLSSEMAEALAVKVRPRLIRDTRAI